MIVSQSCLNLNVSESEYVGLLQMRGGGARFYWANSNENQREAEISINAFAGIIGAVVVISPRLACPNFIDWLRQGGSGPSIAEPGASVTNEVAV